ncbi:MAG: sterol desaturase family protein [Gemmataceae bacterium]|nr:sterol desaturase family protein [Gemmataceae bacterium]
MAQILGLAAGLAVLGVIFGVMERAWPAVRGQRRWRRGIKTDICYFFWDPFVNRTVGFAAVVIVALVLAALAGTPLDGESVRAWARRDTFVSGQPAWLQALEVFVLLDVIGYWSHRAFHHVGQLWRIHSVHHSSKEVDWLSAGRVHPLNEAGTRAAQAVPLLLFGFDPTLLVAAVPLLTFYAIYLHANVSWDYGPLRYVVASPVFHRWHHTTELEGIDKNFAGFFPWVDLLFGSCYLPRDRQPMRFGILGEEVPENLLKQLIYPFRPARKPTPA